MVGHHAVTDEIYHMEDEMSDVSAIFGLRNHIIISYYFECINKHGSKVVNGINTYPNGINV